MLTTVRAVNKEIVLDLKTPVDLGHLFPRDMDIF